MAHEEHGEFIIEFRRVGSQLKVTAIDPVSLREVSMIGAVGADMQQLGKIAARKLQYVLERDSKKS